MLDLRKSHAGGVWTCVTVTAVSADGSTVSTRSVGVRIVEGQMRRHGLPLTSLRSMALL